ncbi:phage virion morphogenesis protein [Diaphorobacter sp.]|uniref:phage virion morphogenesis protein n=1 Tax=Diaphorobacter sp. TaxID=1934310 RepID=UPI00258F3BE7|nr:phage virion morphogenesis protein [Diaphorobacter sp.]
MAEFTALEAWAEGMLRKLQPAQQRRLLVDVARRLRTANAQRMRAQQDPEGQAWEPRKPPGPALRSRREQLRQQAQQRQPMFAKLRQQKHLKAHAAGAAAVVEFASRAQRIARVHHFGEEDAVNPGGPRVRYPARELLGISEDDANALRDVLVDHFRS